MERELLSFRQGRSYLDVICSSRAFTLGHPHLRRFLYAPDARTPQPCALARVASSREEQH